MHLITESSCGPTVPRSAAPLPLMAEAGSTEGGGDGGSWGGGEKTLEMCVEEGGEASGRC